jgi:hypothetical protein
MASLLARAHLNASMQAMLRRLNAGVEQLVNMLGDRQQQQRQQQQEQQPEEGEAREEGQRGGASVGSPDRASPSGSMAGPAVDAPCPAASPLAQADKASNGDAAAVAGQRALQEAAARVTCDLQVTAPRPEQPGAVHVRYSFRVGARRFTLQDDMLIKRGRILRIKRTRGG